MSEETPGVFDGRFEIPTESRKEGSFIEKEEIIRQMLKPDGKEVFSDEVENWIIDTSGGSPDVAGILAEGVYERQQIGQEMDAMTLNKMVEENYLTAINVALGGEVFDAFEEIFPMKTWPTLAQESSVIPKDKLDQANKKLPVNCPYFKRSIFSRAMQIARLVDDSDLGKDEMKEWFEEKASQFLNKFEESSKSV